MFPVSGIVAGVGFIPAVAIGVAGIIVNEMDLVDPRLIVRKMSVLMTNRRKVNIVGGPNANFVEVRNETQVIQMDREFEPLKIIIER